MQSEIYRLLDALPGLVWTALPDGRVQFLSRRWYEWTGVSLEDASGAGWQSSLHPEDRAAALERWQAIVASGKPGELEARMRHFDGTYRWVLLCMSPLTYASGQIVEWCGITTETERHKQAEAEQRARSEEGFRAIWETTPECVKVIARDGTLLRANAAGVVMSGAPSEQAILGRCFYDFVAPQHREHYIEFNEKVCDGQRGFLEFDLINAHGRIFHMETHAAPMRYGDGTIVQLGVTRDITQRRTSEEALSRSRSELAHMARIMGMGALTASIAHEVNQPLSGIITNASTCLRLLSADPPNVDGALETVHRALRDANRASEVINGLRSLFARKPPVMEALDLNEATREVIALSSSDLKRGRIVLQTELAADLPAVMGDRVQLQQVLINLLRNAVDAMSCIEDRPRELVIGTELTDDGRVRAFVRDSGVGLNPSEMDRLFQTFHSSKSDGMGIGLSVSRSIIENHGGRLWATPNDGPGATFSFLIPSQPTPW
jgi:PAS domain S-box-containing protein